jgi:hypothetical protein
MVVVYKVVNKLLMPQLLVGVFAKSFSYVHTYIHTYICTYVLVLAQGGPRSWLKQIKCEKFTGLLVGVFAKSFSYVCTYVLPSVGFRAKFCDGADCVVLTEETGDNFLKVCPGARGDQTRDLLFCCLFSTSLPLSHSGFQNNQAGLPDGIFPNQKYQFG